MVLAGAGLAFVGVADQIFFGPAASSGMKLHFTPVGKPAPPRPRSPDFFDLGDHVGGIGTSLRIRSQAS